MKISLTSSLNVINPKYWRVLCMGAVLVALTELYNKSFNLSIL